jgi:hypothetical protein
MSEVVVALGAGIIFLLIAIVGGGFAIREIVMPKVPNWARVVSGIAGLLLVLPFMLTAFSGYVGRGAASPAENGGRPHSETRSGIEIDTEPATSRDQIRLTELAASARNEPPQVGDTINVTYSLTNVGNQPIRLEYTFVGARNPADENKDSEGANEGSVLAPGETVQAEGRVFLDSAGTWLLWPCYTLPTERYCPDEWKSFSFIVE